MRPATKEDGFALVTSSPSCSFTVIMRPGPQPALFPPPPTTMQKPPAKTASESAFHHHTSVAEAAVSTPISANLSRDMAPEGGWPLPPTHAATSTAASTRASSLPKPRTALKSVSPEQRSAWRATAGTPKRRLGSPLSNGWTTKRAERRRHSQSLFDLSAAEHGAVTWPTRQKPAPRIEVAIRWCRAIPWSCSSRRLRATGCEHTLPPYQDRHALGQHHNTVHQKSSQPPVAKPLHRTCGVG